MLDEKSPENVLIYDNTYKISYGEKYIRNGGYIRKYNRIRYLALFHSYKKHERNFDIIRYLIMLKSNISDVYSNKYAKIKIKNTLNNTIRLFYNVYAFISIALKPRSIQ